VRQNRKSKDGKPSPEQRIRDKFGSDPEVWRAYRKAKLRMFLFGLDVGAVFAGIVLLFARVI